MYWTSMKSLVKVNDHATATVSAAGRSTLNSGACAQGPQFYFTVSKMPSCYAERTYLVIAQYFEAI